MNRDHTVGIDRCCADDAQRQPRAVSADHAGRQDRLRQRGVVGAHRPGSSMRGSGMPTARSFEWTSGEIARRDRDSHTSSRVSSSVFSPWMTGFRQKRCTVKPRAAAATAWILSAVANAVAPMALAAARRRASGARSEAAGMMSIRSRAAGSPGRVTITSSPSANICSIAAVMERVQSVVRGIEPHDSAERYSGLGVDVVQDGDDRLALGGRDRRRGRFQQAPDDACHRRRGRRAPLRAADSRSPRGRLPDFGYRLEPARTAAPVARARRRAARLRTGAGLRPPRRAGDTGGDGAAAGDARGPGRIGNGPRALPRRGPCRACSASPSSATTPAWLATGRR